jgi:hypothetical protein
MRQNPTDINVVPEPEGFMKTAEFIFSDVHALQCELAAETLRSSGTLRLAVNGWSMLPTVWPGDTLIVEQAESNAVCAGDIVLFIRDRRLFAHRVVGKSSPGRSIRTRGDAMRQMDAPVSTRELLGRVVSIERKGKCIESSRELNAASRSMAALAGRSRTAARVAVAMHEALRNF